MRWRRLLRTSLCFHPRRIPGMPWRPWEHRRRTSDRFRASVKSSIQCGFDWENLPTIPRPFSRAGGQAHGSTLQRAAS